jgi:zinc D-Ala-D-Ala dipeptidase
MIKSFDKSDFIFLDVLEESLKVTASYATLDNFTGTIIPGYKSQRAMLAKAPARALCRAHKMAMNLGFGLNIFDGYRPVKAVNYFKDWSFFEENNFSLKERFYPNFTRRELFEKGFISLESAHSRGSAVDLTLYEIETNQNLDMGGEFDYFHDISSTFTNLINNEQMQNRMILKNIMEQNGFTNYSQEWWHFSFVNEPYSDQYFDFDIE